MVGVGVTWGQEQTFAELLLEPRNWAKCFMRSFPHTKPLSRIIIPIFKAVPTGCHE